MVKENRRKTRISQGQRRVSHWSGIWQCIWDSIVFLQLFDQRSKHVKDSEKKYWLQLSSACMNEESMAEDENGDKYIKRHPPNWRSASMSTCRRVVVAVGFCKQEQMLMSISPQTVALMLPNSVLPRQWMGKLMPQLFVSSGHPCIAACFV